MRLTKIIAGLFLIFVLSGCATTTIKYTMDKDLYKREVPLDYKTVVDVFEDIRPEGEHSGVVSAQNKAGFLFTKDKDFKPDIDIQISQMLTEHFDKANMFSQVELRNVDNNLDADAAKAESLKEEGVDLVIIGNLKHFYGFQSGVAGGAFAFGALGALVEAMTNHKTVGAKVEYSDIKVFDVRNEEVLWQGNIENSFEEKDAFYKGPVVYSLRALKEANDKLIQKINEVLTSLKPSVLKKEENLLAEEQSVQVNEELVPIETTLASQQITSNVSIEQPAVSAVTVTINAGAENIRFTEFIRQKVENYLSAKADIGAGNVCLSFIVSPNGSISSLKVIDEKTTADVLTRAVCISAMNVLYPFKTLREDMPVNPIAVEMKIRIEMSSVAIGNLPGF